MKKFKLNTNSEFNEKNINLAIGNFDGLHLGHQRIIEELINISKSSNSQSTVLSFLPHPREYFSKLNNPFNIITTSYKKKLLEDLDIDIYIDFEFNEALASLQPEEFIKEILVNKFSIKNIIVGSDFRFGKNRKGDLEFLKLKSEEYKFKIIIIDSVIDKQKEEKYSSSLIREYIMQGEFEKVSDALNRNWHITGNVIVGDKRASQMKFPTANVKPGNHILPLKGVYCVYAFINGNRHNGIANFGERPTIIGSDILLETHIFDFNEDIYGKELTVEFLTFIRKEQKFNNFEKLTEQIKIDIQKAKNYHKI